MTTPHSQLASSQNKRSVKTRDLTTATIKHPPFAYVHLTSTTQGPPDTATDGTMDVDTDTDLDALEVRAYCTAALRQFLGHTGEAMSVDILQVRGSDVWLRISRQDLGSFTAALTAYPGLARGGGLTTVLRLRACGDWLGSLLGRTEEHDLWTS